MTHAGQISMSRPLHAELFYHVLAHLDLGHDAASLFDPKLPKRPWTASLLEAYCYAPGRLQAQILPLVSPDLPTLQQRLQSQAFAGLQDEPGQRLCTLLQQALLAELPAMVQRWTGPGHEDRSELGQQVMDWIEPLLQRLRHALYDGSAMEPPDLGIVDCQALTTPGGTHGRCVAPAGRLVVAVSLAAPREQVLCQVLHEQVHQLTDGPIRHELRQLSQDTRLGSGGFTLHRRLEHAAVERGQQLIDGQVPELGPAYRRWRRRYGC